MISEFEFGLAIMILKFKQKMIKEKATIMKNKIKKLLK